MKLILSFLMIMLLGMGSFAQSTDSIALMKTPTGGLRFFQYEQPLKTPEVMGVMRVNPEAYKVMKSARNLNVLSTTLGIAGGVCLGWPVGTYLSGGKPQWILAGAGAALIAVAIPFGIKATKQSKEAVRLYNNDLRPVSRKESTSSFEFRLSPGGLGLVWRW